ncbi:MAG TPA: HlyD family efflux transporter periplasmic adaptor subunit [Tepidisphaeraceae bacterium]|jgi:multidrug resistance efflux pump
MTQIAAVRKSSSLLPAWSYRVAAALVVLGVVGGVGYLASPLGASSGGGGFKSVPVKQGPFEVKINVKGELQAVDNIDIICLVEGANTITDIVPEGASVKKGDVLATIDSSLIRQKVEDSQIELQRATADVTTAKEMLDIQKSQNDANLEAATVALQLAQIDMTKYTEGEYPSLLAAAKLAVERAQTGLKTKQDDLSQTRSLFSKGFVTATDVKTKELDMQAAQQEVVKATSDLLVLEKYTHEANMATRRNTLAQSEQRLERTKRENAANLNQKSADLIAKSQQLEVIQRRSERYKEQILACQIIAPADGLVVYQNGNDRDRTAIAQGAQVRERQTMMRLPDTSKMKVVFKANENQVSMLTIGQPATVKLSNSAETYTGTVTKISPVPDSTNRWMDPDRRDFPVDVTIDTKPTGAKPGTTGEVSILINRIDEAVTIPIAGLYSAGAERYAFVPEGEAARPVKLTIGRVNEQDVEVISGLTGGQNVVLLEAGQGRVLLEKAGIKVAEPQSSGQAGDGKRPGRRNGGGGATSQPADAAPPAKPAGF